jgi:hypothetical protein
VRMNQFLKEGGEVGVVGGKHPVHRASEDTQPEAGMTQDH